MRKAYKVAIEKTDKGYLVKVPDFDAMTQGEDIADCMYMARDLICVAALGCEDLNQPVPEPNTREFIPKADDIITYVDVDIDEYRKKHDNKKIKKTLSIASWINKKAEEEGINFSRTLEEALLKKLDKR